MSRLTKAQIKDFETVRYFIPKSLNIEITEEDIKKFFEYSERGLHKEEIKPSHFSDGFNALVQGKIWRGRHMEIYEEGVMSGDMPYAVILENAPRSVIDFMKKEMFKGADSKLIEEMSTQHVE